ncbi:hypothetical protein [Ancylobacter terrae]|uniref:hypothetical protein n=1 Tax=Ancylobacter sp. sgz301288 TaxID=3342077 RepID=UPI00385C6C45
MASVSNRSETKSLPGGERPSPSAQRGSFGRSEAGNNNDRRPPVGPAIAPTGSIAAIEFSLGC